MIKNNQQYGFTLIEMIVSLALFSVVITMSVGALLILIATNQQLQNEQNIMTNLSFALDSMTREIRTGTDYYCVSRESYFFKTGADNVFSAGKDTGIDDGDRHEALSGTNDCENGIDKDFVFKGISFKEAGNSITGDGASRILYLYYRPDNIFEEQAGKIMRRVGSGDPQSIISDGLAIVDAQFYVSGTTKGDTEQPTVTIYIEAKEKNNYVTDRTYKVQTTVTQRTLDI